MSQLGEAMLPVPAATITPGLEPFWEALADGELRLPYSRTTGEVLWYPRVADAGGHLEVEWRAVSGHGVVYSATVVRRPTGPYRESGPYVLAYVTLEEGPRVLTHIVGVPPEEVHIGMRVRAVIESGADGAVILRFRRDDGDDAVRSGS
ncbi:Zn-ribbon domain-containing OB-fold protein [Microbispora sp. CA-102843]|uniref:Zn-ribbon domain-containing OB-fold protein n=1 Tax=Microbispora sp. CA-102843 TaxID=3239952 RepID=UPI003D945186